MFFRELLTPKKQKQITHNGSVKEIAVPFTVTVTEIEGVAEVHEEVLEPQEPGFPREQDVWVRQEGQ